MRQVTFKVYGIVQPKGSALMLELGKVASAPQTGSTEALVAELATLCPYFLTTDTTTLQGQPMDEDYRRLFQRTHKLLREAIAALSTTSAPPQGWQHEKCPRCGWRSSDGGSYEL